MSLEPGARLGPYEVLSSIGAGGMGEVYRARDTRLQRDVAIKVLPDLFAADLSASRDSNVKRRSSPRSIILTSRRSTASKTAHFDSPFMGVQHVGILPGSAAYHIFAVSADGQRFLVPHLPSGDTAGLTLPIAVVENWAAGLK
jgi:hypothetical protein